MAEHDPTAVPHVGGDAKASSLKATRAPTQRLREWFYWLSVSELDLPSGTVLEGGMLTDHSCLRIITGGRWTAETARGIRVFDPEDTGLALYFGPQSRFMKLSVDGSFRVLTLHLRAGATVVLGGPSQVETRDCIFEHARIVGHGDLATRFDRSAPDDVWMDMMEAELARFLDRTPTKRPDPLTTAFEQASLSEPEMSISAFAELHGLSPRTLERTIKRDYGLSPKKVLRRARALDMAAALLGVVDPAEEDELELRYFDQSHRIKETRHFFGMTPSELTAKADPLLRNNLEIRQTRRLEALGRWSPDQPMPWSA